MKFIKCAFIFALLIGAIFLSYYAINPLQAPSWTGFAPYDEKLQAKKYKTLWDWLNLFIIPMGIAFSVWWLNTATKIKDRKIEADRQEQTALESYFDYIGTLILEKGLLDISRNTEAKILARTRTLNLLRTLDATRKARVILFLYEAQLISKDPIISLFGADFSFASLSCATLTNVEIRGAYFRKADLKNAKLSDSNFIGCDFTSADLSGADLSRADLKYAKLERTKKKNWTIDGTIFSQQKTSQLIEYCI